MGDMVQEVRSATPVRREVVDAWHERRWRITSGLLGLLVLGFGAVLVLTGSQRSEIGDLVGEVASGEVTQVEVVGDLDATGRQGEHTVELRWRDWRDRHAEVRVVRGSPDGSSHPGDRAYVTSQDPRELLLAVAPDLTIVERPWSGTSGGTFMDWRVSGSWVLVGLVAWLLVLLLLVSGPEPRRATRWAWFWIWALGTPVGALAFLLLGGPLSSDPVRPSGRRLTGGWAFVLAAFLLAGLRESLTA